MRQAMPDKMSLRLGSLRTEFLLLLLLCVCVCVCLTCCPNLSIAAFQGGVKALRLKGLRT